MALTTAGDVVMSMMLAMIADRVGRRKTLAFGALGVTGCGIVFATCSNYYALLAASIIGVITPTGNEIGPFKAIEESMICHLTDTKERPRVLGWYYMLGAVGTGTGLLICGWFVELLQVRWDPLASYRAVFWLYAAIGIVKLYLSCSLSAGVELQPKKQSISGIEGNPLLSEDYDEESKSPQRSTIGSQIRSLLPKFDRESHSFVIKFSLIFIGDQIGNGILPSSWLTYFYKYKFDIADDLNGVLFFCMLMVAALSNLIAGGVTQRLGFVPAMLATHIPSTIGAALIPIPKTVVGTLPWLLLRWAFVDMNQVPRSAFIAAAVLVCRHSRPFLSSPPSTSDS